MPTCREAYWLARRGLGVGEVGWQSFSKKDKTLQVLCVHMGGDRGCGPQQSPLSSFHRGFPVQSGWEHLWVLGLGFSSTRTHPFLILSLCFSCPRWTLLTFLHPPSPCPLLSALATGQHVLHSELPGSSGQKAWLLLQDGFACPALPSLFFKAQIIHSSNLI